MNQGYRDQFTPADLHPLSSTVLTKGDIATGHALMKACADPRVSHEFAMNQAHASAYCANALVISLTKSQHWEDEQTVVPEKPRFNASWRPPRHTTFDQVPTPVQKMITELDSNCTKSAVAGAIFYNRRTLGQWLRDYETGSNPGESITEFITRRINQQKGNSDV